MPDKMMVGINIHNNTYAPYRATQKQNLDDCAAAGMKIIRFNSSAKTPDAIAEIREMADGCHERGMKFLLCIDHYSEWQNWNKSLEELEVFYENFMENLSATLQGTVDIYQVFNETDVPCINGNIFNIVLPAKMGRELGEYDCVLREKCLYAMRGALRGLKKGYAEVKTSMNFCWWHTALIYYLYEQGCRWDVVGLDWYSDGEELSSIDLIVADVCKTIPDADIMICETNQWMNLHERWDEAKRDIVRNKETRDALQAEWTASFVQKVYDMNEPRFKGIIFYELLDEPRFEQERGSYHGESHFGFIECDEEGGNRAFKPAWHAVSQKIKELGL